MSKDNQLPDNNSTSTERASGAREGPLGSSSDVVSAEVPHGVDRRTFFMRSAVIGATAVIRDSCISAQERTERSTAPPPALSPNLNVVKKGKGPVMTTIDEFYKVGPGPSSSHTIGPMRITYDFYQRCTKLPADQLDTATALKVHLLRQPQRHWLGPRHGARLARGLGRTGAGDCRSRVS